MAGVSNSYYLEDCPDDMSAELFSGADCDCPGELVRCDGLVSQRVHPHGDLEVVQVVEKQAKVSKLGKSDADQVVFLTVSLLGQTTDQPVNDGFVPVEYTNAVTLYTIKIISLFVVVVVVVVVV